MNIESKTYFTSDGTFGDASELEIIDTTQWTDEDWDEIQNCSDSDRLSLAWEIERKYA
jgi:hypothetical protein